MLSLTTSTQELAKINHGGERKSYILTDTLVIKKFIVIYVILIIMLYITVYKYLVNWHT